MAVSPQRREMVEVELVEGELDEVAPGGSLSPVHDAVGGGGPSGSRTVGLSRRVLAGATAVIVVVTGAVVTAVQAADPPVADLVGSAPSLVSPLAESWRAEAPRGWTVAAGLLLTTSRRADGLHLVAREMTTGVQRWTLPPQPDSGGIACPVAVADERGPLVVCQAFGPLQQSHEHLHGFAQQPGRLLLVSAADGRVVEEIPLEARHVGFAAAEEDLVLAEIAIDPDGLGGATRSAVVTIERRDLRTGRDVWRTGVPVDFHPAATPFTLTVEGGLVVLRGLTTAVLDAERGSELQSVGASSHPSMGDGVPVLTVWPHGFAIRGDNSRWPTPTEWYALDGTPLGTFDGAVAEPAVHDGSEPGIVLTSTAGGGSIRGVDAIGGQPLWSVDLELGDTVLRLDGSVVITGLDTLRSLDLRTGREEWRSSVEALEDAQPVSDGSFVLVVGDALGVGRTLSAISLTDGSLLWRTAMPAGTRAVQVADDHVVAVGPGVVVSLD